MKKRRQSSSLWIIKGYLAVILIGTILLCMPFAANGEYGNFWQRLFTSWFTATSATCVTGLVVQNTGVYWTLFGQIVILAMIQVGGLGFMVVIYLVATFLRKKITLHERKTLMQAQGFIGLSGIVSLVKKIFLFALMFETLGAAILTIRFIPLYGTAKGIYYSIFLSISAFCNAGFDPLGMASLTAFTTDILVNLTLIFLIICGGLGFVVWDNIFKSKFKFKDFFLHTKIVLITTLSLLVVSTGLFLLFEFRHAFKDLNIGQKFLASFFQATTCRTAGFAAVDQAALTDPSILLSSILMFIGGSSGSTAGGIKTTTFAVLVLTILSTTIRRPNITVGKRQLDTAITKHASAIFLFYLFMVSTAVLIILGIESDNILIRFQDVLFEVTSAVGTTGLSVANTEVFSIFSQAILIVLMFVGRLGALSIIAAFREKSESGKDLIKHPTEKILVG